MAKPKENANAKQDPGFDQWWVSEYVVNEMSKIKRDNIVRKIPKKHG